MADLIDREKLLEAYCTEIYESGYRGEGHDDEVIRIINRQDREYQPTAQERLHGHWVEKVERWSDGNIACVDFYCSECGEYGCENDNFCPHCGADMREDGDTE